jgi:hypothetical protein
MDVPAVRNEHADVVAAGLAWVKRSGVARPTQAGHPDLRHWWRA